MLGFLACTSSFLRYSSRVKSPEGVASPQFVPILAINCSVDNSTGSLGVGFERPLGKLETFKEYE